jgi:hypothetical protein
MNPRRLVMTLAVAAVMILPIQAAAQLDANLGGLSGDNAKGYLGPLPSALSATLNAAIFRSGNVPKSGVNFDIGVRVMGISYSDDDRSFTPTDPPGFSSTTPGTKVPTIIGDVNAVGVSGQGGTTLYYPGGFDLKNFAVAVPQLSIGNFAGTRLVARWISLDVGDNEIGHFKLFGIGGQHSISQYFESLPIDVAAGAFYQTFKLGDKLIDTKALHVDVTGSKRFSILEPYVGIGYDSFKMESNYHSDTNNVDISVDFDRKNSAHLTVGASALLAIVKINAEFNAAAEKGVAVGLSFGK